MLINVCVKSYIKDKTKLRFNSDLSFFTAIHDIVKERIYSINTFPDNFPMIKGLAKDIGEDCSSHKEHEEYLEFVSIFIITKLAQLLVRLLG